MLNRRTWIIAVLAVLLMATLAGCAAGEVQVPARDVKISVDDAMAGQNAGLQGLMSGSVTWSEGQFSSFLTELLKQNSGPNQPIDSIKAWFDPDNAVTLQVVFKDGVLPAGNSVTMQGTLGVQDGHVALNVKEASMNGMTLSGPLADVVSAYVNHVLSDPAFGVAAKISTDQGNITISLGG